MWAWNRPPGDAGSDDNRGPILPVRPRRMQTAASVPLWRTRFVLIQPSHAGNVGAVARAMGWAREEG